MWPSRTHFTMLLAAALPLFVAAPGRARAAADGPSEAPTARTSDATEAWPPSGLHSDAGMSPGTLFEAPPVRRGPIAPGGLALPVVETLGTELVVLSVNRWVRDEPWARVSSNSIGENMRRSWNYDGDGYWVNQLGHPYQGTWSFTAARSSGLGFWASAPLTFGASALWELAGETENPSFNDQVTTTFGGIVLGEILHRFANALRMEGGAWSLAAAVLEPVGVVNARLVGPVDRMHLPASRWQLALGASDGSASAGTGSYRSPFGRFSFTYGLAGDEALQIDRPFDHFVLDVGWAASPDPAADIRARGLLAGGTFQTSSGGGLYGAYLSYDLTSPPGARVSTVALGGGGSVRTELTDDLAVEGDAVVSAVLLGAGGTVTRVEYQAAERDYRFGPGQQALLEARVLAWNRARLGLSVRQYLLFGSDEHPGTELIVHGTASLSIRITRHQGLGLEVSRQVRRAEAGGQLQRSGGSAVCVYWALMGGG